jgi:hypothetical protein
VCNLSQFQLSIETAQLIGTNEPSTVGNQGPETDLPSIVVISFAFGFHDSLIGVGNKSLIRPDLESPSRVPQSFHQQHYDSHGR